MAGADKFMVFFGYILHISEKKHLQKQVKAHIKKQINQSTSLILSDISEIVSKY